MPSHRDRCIFLTFALNLKQGPQHNLTGSMGRVLLQTVGTADSAPFSREAEVPGNTPQSSTIGDQPTQIPQSPQLDQYTLCNGSRVSLISAFTADTAPSSRDPSIFSKGSSVWSADTTFSTSTSSSALPSISQQ